MIIPLDPETIFEAVNAALDEDIGRGDLTSRSIVRPGLRARGSFLAKEDIVLAGLEVADAAFSAFDYNLQIESAAGDGEVIKAGKVFARITGEAQTLLASERVALNFLQHLSGIATLTRKYVDAIAGADVVILALALTPDTEGMISRSELEQMQSHAWIVNVARGRHIVTDDLVWALEHGVIGGAGLDVTDPEPLPADHPLWRLPNCIITPHVGNTPEMAVPLLSERITANVRRFAAGEPLIGPVHVDLGY